MGLGRFGFAGGLGVLVRGWAGSLGDFDLGPKLTRGFHLNGPGEVTPLGMSQGIRNRDQRLERGGKSQHPN